MVILGCVDQLGLMSSRAVLRSCEVLDLLDVMLQLNMILCIGIKDFNWPYTYPDSKNLYKSGRI